MAAIRAEDDWAIPGEGPVTFGSKKSPYVQRRLSDADSKSAAPAPTQNSAAVTPNPQAKATTPAAADPKPANPEPANAVAAKPPAETAKVSSSPASASVQQDVQDTGLNEIDIEGALEGLPAPYRDLLKRQMLAAQKHSSETKSGEPVGSKGVQVSLSDSGANTTANVASKEAQESKPDEAVAAAEGPTMATAAIAKIAAPANTGVMPASGISAPSAATSAASNASPEPSAPKIAEIKPVASSNPPPSLAEDRGASENSSSSGVAPVFTTWNQSLGQTIELLEKQVSDESNTDENLRYHREISLRMLYVAARKLDEALEPIDGLSDQENLYLRHQMQAMYEASNPDAMPVRSRHLSLVMNSQRLATNHLASVSNLEVRSTAFCTEVERYGVVTKFPKYQFAPDQEVLLYCEIENVAAKEVRDGFETQLQGSYEIVDSTGKRIAEQILPMEPDICQNHRRDYFIVYKIYMPQQISAGQYKLRLTVEDMNARKFGQSTLDFQIKK